jgi:hypothetical protein
MKVMLTPIALSIVRSGRYKKKVKKAIFQKNKNLSQ